MIDDRRDIYNEIDLIQRQEVINNYLAWLSLPYNEKNKIRGKWTDYYKSVYETKAAKRFFFMRDLFKTKQYQEVIKLAKKATRQRENEDWELVEPNEMNGDELYHDPIIIEYLKKQYKENSNVRVIYRKC
jgi:hypothetical protein